MAKKNNNNIEQNQQIDHTKLHADPFELELSIATIIELIPDAMLIVGSAGKIALANKKAVSLFGYSYRELLALTIEDLVPQRYRQQHVQYRHNSFAAPSPRRMGAAGLTPCLRRRDGTEIACDISLSPVTAEHQQYCFCSIRDMTLHHNIKNELQQKERAHRQLLENTNAVPWQCDANTWQFGYVGPQIVDLAGYDVQEWLAPDFWLSRLYLQDRDKVVEICQYAVKNSDNFEFDYRMVAKDGQIIWIKDMVSVIRTAGQPQFLRGFMIDITESKTLNETLNNTLGELVKVKGRLESLADSAPIGLCYLDSQLRFVHINKFLAELNGLTVEQHLGQKITDILPNLTGITQTLQQVLLDGKTVMLERVEGLTLNNRPASWTVSCQPDKGGNGDILGLNCAVNDNLVVNSLKEENEILREEAKHRHHHTTIIGQSPAMCQLLHLVDQVAPTESGVMITGETGTGKEIIAKEIHNLSLRAARAMITVNCAALPATLIESELFGREKGAFTGAVAKQIGRFEAADHSTIFLDEIGELPLELQPKLLRVLQESEFERLGSVKVIKVNVRIIAATNKNLLQLVNEGKFRADLYYRLNTFPLMIAPLRERRSDIPELVWAFIEEYNQMMGKRVEVVSEHQMQQLVAYSWPGNVRELRNIIERSMILSQQRTLNVQLPQQEASTKSGVSNRLLDIERQHILNILGQTNWRIRGKLGAAEILDLKPSTLESRMAKMRIKRG